MTEQEQEMAVRPSTQTATNGMAIAGMTLAIATWTIGWVFFFLPWVQVAVAATAIILSGIGIKNCGRQDDEGRVYGGRGMAITGVVLGSLAIPLLLLWMFVFTSMLTNGS